VSRRAATARAWLLVVGLLAGACVPAAIPPAPPPVAGGELPVATPEDRGVDSRRLIAMTESIREQRLPVFSVLISRDGALVYELYTSSLTRDHAHYLMSVTKSVVSALVGIAIDRRLLDSPEAPIVRTLPPRLFPTPADVERFSKVTVRHVLGMSALDAPDPPRSTTPEAMARQRRFWSDPNRVALALEQPLLPSPGRSYQYNDVTPQLATGVLQYAAGTSALEFAEAHLFRPLGFRNYEWMHQDPTGIDNGGYGLRLRPIDMQKFGILYLDSGAWRGQQLISRAWVERSFTPWNRSRADLAEPNYGWFWWRSDYAAGWRGHAANGWRGQHIAVFPHSRVVVTMTAYLHDRDDGQTFRRLVEHHVVPAVGAGARRRDDAAAARLRALLEDVRTAPSPVRSDGEPRMAPSVEPKTGRRVFTDRR
jgi:CubicO group peptidase (beta-lactamase class C family)